MIKLIASDMDGTLLDGEGKLPPDFYKVLKVINNRSMRFVVASGRSYSTLKMVFGKHCDELDYICDNGAYVVENGKCTDKSVIDSVYVRSVLKSLEEFPTARAVLCAEKTMYNKPDKDFEKEVSNFYINRTLVPDLYAINEDVFKIAIFDNKGDIDAIIFGLNKKLRGKLNIQRTGEFWVDVMNAEVSKGAALEALQLRRGISWSETMAFGDYDNDISLLEKAYYSFAMENAVDEVKKTARYTTKSNRQYGVISEIKCLFRME